MPKLPEIGPKNIFMIVVLAIVGVYLWGIFTTTGTGTCTKADVTKDKFDCKAVGQTYDKTEFIVPEQEKLESTSLWITKFLIIGTAVFLAYTMVMRFVGRNPSKRDIATVILLIVGVYFLWIYIIEPTNLFGATSFAQISLDNIGHKTAQMLGIS